MRAGEVGDEHQLEAKLVGGRGEAEAHARSAVGMAELPFGMPVEIEGEVQIVTP